MAVGRRPGLSLQNGKGLGTANPATNHVLEASNDNGILIRL